MRHRAVLLYLGRVVGLFGIVLLAVDWLEVMPLSWTLWEGPFVILFGIAIVWLTGKLDVDHGPATS